MKPKRNNQIAVDLLALSVEDKTDLVKALVLRRLFHGEPLTRDQLEIAMKADFYTIAEIVPDFDPERFAGMDTLTLYKSMVAGQLITERNAPGVSPQPATVPADDEKILVERGPRADEWMAAKGDEFEWLVYQTPMSTRGIFDNLKVKPGKERTIEVTFDEFRKTHEGSKKDVIFDNPEDRPYRNYRSSV